MNGNLWHLQLTWTNLIWFYNFLYIYFLSIFNGFSLDEHLLIQEMDFKKSEGNKITQITFYSLLFHSFFSLNLYFCYCELLSSLYLLNFCILLYYLSGFFFSLYFFHLFSLRHSFDPRFFRETENPMASKLAYELYVRMDGGTVRCGNYSMSNKSMLFIFLDAVKCMCSSSCCYKMCWYRIQYDSAS